MSQQPGQQNNRKQYWLNLTLAGAVGQVGCVTLIIILAAVFGGLWLDARFGTRPAFTLGLLVISIPVSLIAMLFIVRLVTSKIKANPPKEDESNEEVGIGNDS
jgi:hypothetical protein